ncbi:MAG TPA: DUF1007 family protein [Xanthobacteraceae bacterium]|nr:DUF1007 family protein [Xanthobacteraceae bacterium]
MFRHLQVMAFAAFAVTILGGEARTHPHVWVSVKSEVVYAPDGSATAVQHHWTFDEMFSTMAVQGMDTKKPGGLTREDLAQLAELNVTSLKDFDFFTFAKADGKKPEFTEPKEYWLEHKDGALTLHFTLPFKQPVKAKKLEFEIYDTSYFVDFVLLQKDPVALVGAPAQCKLAARGARENAAAPQQQMSESFFEQLAAGSNFGSQFANRISVSCP